MSGDSSFNPVTKTFLLAFHGPERSDYAMEIAPGGKTSNVSKVTDTAQSGHFNPRLAVNTKTGEWLLVASRDYNGIVAQKLRGTQSEAPVTELAQGSQ